MFLKNSASLGNVTGASNMYVDMTAVVKVVMMRYITTTHHYLGTSIDVYKLWVCKLSKGDMWMEWVYKPPFPLGLLLLYIGKGEGRGGGRLKFRSRNFMLCVGWVRVHVFMFF